MSVTIIKPQSREEWLHVRQQGIGSSDVATILGVNKYCTPLQLWRIRKGIDAPQPENFAMKAGHFLEDAVANFYADHTGNEIVKNTAGDWIVRCNEKPFLQVSPDRLFVGPGERHNSSKKRILECKTTSSPVDPDNLPKYWFCQLQYQLGVTGYTQGALAWLSASHGYEFGCKEIKFDPEFFAFVVEKVERFWVDNIQGNIEPQPISVEDIILKFPKQTPGASITATDELVQTYLELKETKAAIAELTKKKEELENIIKLAMEDNESLIGPDGKTLCTWKAGKDRQKFDEKTFAVNHPDLHEFYSSSVPSSRTFLTK